MRSWLKALNGTVAIYNPDFSSPDDVDPGPAGQRRGRVRDEARLLRGVASRGPHLLGAQRQDAATQFQDLHQEPDWVT